MKNLTISLPEAVLDRLRLQAASRKVSVNRFVGELLRLATAEPKGNWESEHAALYQLMPELRSDGPWTREEIHGERLS